LAPQGAPGGGCDNSHSDPHAAPPQWCEAGAGELSANGAPVSEDVKLASGDSCSQFCCWWGSDCGSCGDDWNNRMYEAGCQVPCTGANCGPGQSHQYFNTQPGALDNCKPPGFTCEAGELTGGGAAALFASKQAGNLTAKLASEEGCCSFDGCKTCADWCTQQGKDVCLAPQGAPGGGCDNSHSDPSAHPPQWCEAGANQSPLEQSLTAESYPHINPPGCSGGCDCDWLPTDNCQDKEWCCAGACRDYYHNPAGC